MAGTFTGKMAVKICAFISIVFSAALTGCDSSTPPKTEPSAMNMSDAGAEGLSGTGGMNMSDEPSCTEKKTEVCDGQDNDCDGKTDEDFPIGNPCQVDKGECTSLGVWTCASDNMKAICEAPPFEMADEVCDGKDNDCDGKIDETFAFETNDEHCGRCDNACAIENANSICREGQCRFNGCEPGFVDFNEELADGCECRLTNGGVETCDGSDNDCDGRVDEAFELGQPCASGVGLCAATGTTVCSEDGVSTTCNAEVSMPEDEVCNGYDDDCDGRIDETFDVDQDGAIACPNVDCANCPADIDCAFVCGNVDCNDADPNIHPRAEEVCEDNIDQNCDGTDAPCSVLTGRLNQFAMIRPNEEGCRDIDGNGTIDNVLGPLAGAANALLEAEILAGNINLIGIFYGISSSQVDARFDFAIGYALEGQLTPESVNAEGRPNVLFTGARMNFGRLQAGPQATDIPLPVPGNAVILTAENSLITGTVTLPFEVDGVTGVKVVDGLLTAAAPRDALIDTIRRNAPNLLFLVEGYEPDIDTDGDGVNDALSICARFTVEPASVGGIPPARNQ